MSVEDSTLVIFQSSFRGFLLKVDFWGDFRIIIKQAFNPLLEDFS